MADISIKGRSPLLKGGRVGLARGGGSAPFLRGRSGSSNIKAPRGSEGWKQMQKAEAKIGRAITKKPKGAERATGPIKHKGKVIGTRIAKAGSKKAMGSPRAPMTKGDYAMKNFKKRIQKTPDKVFHQKGYIEPGATKSTRAKVQKKKIIQAERTRLNKQKRKPSDKMAKGGRI